jgi:hypothetical protein
MNIKTTRIHGPVGILLAGLLFPVPTHADALWPTVKYGMTALQVAAALPQATPAPGRDKLVSGASEMLRVDKIPLAGRTFTAQFFFSDRVLAQIMVSPPEWESNETNLAIFEDLIRAFSAKYGQEFKRSVSARPSGLSASAEWTNGGEKVVISVIPVTQDTSMLNVAFRPGGQIPSKSGK